MDRKSIHPQGASYFCKGGEGDGKKTFICICNAVLVSREAHKKRNNVFTMGVCVLTAVCSIFLNCMKYFHNLKHFRIIKLF